MNDAPPLERPSPPSGRVPVARLLLLVPLVAGVYFVSKRAFPYLLVTPDSYGSYFWPRVQFVLPHVVFGIVAIAVGAFQFSTRIRSRHVALHRLGGRIYLVSVMLGGVAAIALASSSSVSIVYATGLGTLGVVWITASLMAFAAIRRRNIAQHRMWMVRSYVLTFAFPAFRFVEEGLALLEIGTRFQQLELAAWTCWAIPLFVAEVILQMRATFRSPTDSSLATG